tara:strand:- start:1425 stop:1781 length:357 start_codon:yes stop_codon:yes gene_type:complete
MQPITIIQRQSPFNSSCGREALDLTLALAAVEHKISMVFSGDAVYQLLAMNTEPEFALKRYQQSFKLFDLYDIEQVYVCQHSLLQRQLEQPEFVIPAKIITPEQLQHLLAAQQQIVCI